MDFAQFLRNVERSGRITGGGRDRWNYLCWLYRASRNGAAVWRVKFRHPAVPGPFELELRENAGSDSYVFGEIFDQGCYAVPLSDPPRTILDLGGNAGIAAVYFSRRWPDAEIATVEPMPHNLAALRRNLTLSAAKARVFEGAIAPWDGEIEMAYGERDGLNSVATDGNARRLRVRAWSVSSVLREMAWRRIDLVKMDIEGFEAQLLAKNNDWLDAVGAICLEIHSPFTADNVRRVLAPRGFTVEVQPSGVIFAQRNHQESGAKG